MICNLSVPQQTGILNITKKIIQNDVNQSTEDILKKVYDVAYHSLINAGRETKQAQEYSVAMTAFVADTLHELTQMEKDNNVLSQFGVDLNKGTTANAINYTNPTEVKKLVGINDKFTLQRNITQFSKEEEAGLKKHIDSIKEAFPKLDKPVKFARKVIGGKSIDSILLRTVENGQPLFHISLFSKNLDPVVSNPSVSNGALLPDGTGFKEPLIYGNMMDHGIRTIFRNKNMSFDEIREHLKNDEDLVNAFSAYTLGKSKAETDPKASPAFNAYFDQFLDDMILTASKIETEYKGYHITDLSDVIENSGMSDEDKQKFFIYSKKMGLIGELDLLAIKPDGSFRVVDIKTSQEGLSEKNKRDYMTQISTYARILAEATGLKPESHGDIFLIQKSYRTVMDNVKENDPSNRRKVVLTGVDKVSEPLLSEDELARRADVYRKQQLANMTTTDKVTEEKPSQKKAQMLSPMAILRRQQAEKNKGSEGSELNMTFNPHEELSTKESIKQQVEWLESVFPELKGDGIRVLPSLLSSTGGKFFLDAVMLAEKSNMGVGYHEGWHRFSQLYLTKEEKVNLYEGVQKSGITFTDREGNKINTKDANFKEVEEFLAEEFRKFAQDPGKYKFPSKEVTGIFNRIWEVLKTFLNYFRKNGQNSPEKLFQQLHDGTFYRGNFSVDNAFWSQLNSFYRNSRNSGEEVLGNTAFLKYRDWADGYLNEYMMANGVLLQSYMNKGGLADLTGLLQRAFQSMRDNMAESLQDEGNSQYQETFNELEKILPTFDDFMRGYLKTTNYASLRRYVGANTEMASKIIDQETKDPVAKAENKGEEPLENSVENADDNMKEFNRGGNEVSAEELASDLVKDFFNGIPELTINEAIPEGETYESYSMINEKGLPEYLNKSKAFYKTLERLEGHFTWDLIEQEMKNPANYEMFPELQIIRDKLFGDHGVITMLDSVTKDIEDNKNKYTTQQLHNKLEEQRKLKEFKNQFQHAMTLAKVRFETLRMNLESPVDDSIFDTGSTKKYNPVQSVENSESVLTSIINDFARGFQENARQEHERMKDAGVHFMDLFDAFNTALTDNNAFEKLKGQKYLYDSVMKTYHMNPYYISEEFPPTVFNDQENTAKIRDFFEMHGINMDPRAFVRDEKEVRIAYNNMKAVAGAYYQYVQERMTLLRTPDSNGRSWVKEAQNLSKLKQDLNNLRNADTLDTDAISGKEQQIFEQQRKIRYIASKIFTTKPIDEILYRDEERAQDKTVRKDDYRKSFALSLPTFLRLAKVQKNYRQYFSSGSMLVGDSTQFSYFLPNQMLLISKLIQYGVKSFDDFEKYPEISHLNPAKNAQLKNSWIISKLFHTDEKSEQYGQRKEEFNLNISVLSQMMTNHEDGAKEDKKMSELSQDEKLLMDFLLTTREGSSEIRRMETSNTAFRISVTRTDTTDAAYSKPVTLLAKGFKDVQFLEQMRNYIQASIHNYVFDLTKEDSEKRIKQRGLSIFEQMLGSEVTDDLKKMIHAKMKENANYNWNNFFKDIQNPDPFDVSDGDKLYGRANDAIANYFEGIAISNEDSVLNMMPKVWSDKTKGLLINLAEKFKGKTKVSDVIKTESNNFPTFSKLLNDPLFKGQVRDFIANDFIMAMEDSMLFFGDYSYYKDPIKRRKIIGNNGVLGITDDTDAAIEKMQVEKGGLMSVWMQHHGLEDTGKDYRLVRKTILKDKELMSKLLKGETDLEMNKELEEAFKKGDYATIADTFKDSPFMNDFRDYYKQIMKKDLNDEEIVKRNFNVFSSFAKMEAADAGAYVSLDLYRKMRQKSNNWTDSDQAEFERQKLIMKQKLGHDYSGKEEEKKEDDAYIAGGPYSSFNIAKLALTGPVYSEEAQPLRPTFDKMGLKVMLPESDWDSKRYLFQQMMEKSIDYMVFDSGSKGYQSKIHDVYDNNGKPKKVDLNYTEHAAGFLKLQQNTAAIKDESNFAVQLRGTFFNIMLLHQKNGVADPELKQHYRDFLTSLKQYVTLNGQQKLASIGLDKDGNFLAENGEPIGKKLFVEKIREQLINIGSTDLSLLDKLNVGKDGDFVNFMEALPLNREIYNVVSGILDDGLRKVQMNGSKMYQTMEIGSGELKGRMREGTLGLKWHGLIRDENGNITGVAPVECKIAFKENFHPLLQLAHPDGARIATLDRLNAALNSDAWRDQHQESLTMVGIRIPLQDNNFTSHMIIRQFLPESEGDSIIVPPEFYKQVGSDNDIDTITTTFKYLDKATGKPIAKPQESYEEITNKLAELRSKLDNQPSKVVDKNSLSDYEKRLGEIRERILQENMFGNAGKSASDLDEELTIEDNGGYKSLRGLKSNKSVLGKAMKKGLHPEIMEAINELVEDMNTKKESSINDNPLVKEIREWSKKERAYKKGINNDILSPIVKFLQHPLSYEYLTETDSIAPIEKLAKDARSIHTGQSAERIGLNEGKTALNDMSYQNNLVNHKNNFQVRTMLGSFVKFSRLLSTLVQMDTTLNREYNSSSIPNLASVSGDLNTLANLGRKFYKRTIWTPLLEKNRDGKIKLSLYDENGERITKNLSMVASSLLDLFKNIDTFPSLGITWNNIKPLIFMMTQGVPFNKAVLFLNNPITQMVEDNKNELGPDYQLRHAIVKTSQDAFDSDIHNEQQYFITKDGKPNFFMQRNGQAAESFLKKKFGESGNFKMDAKEVEQFSRDFFQWRKDSNKASDLKNFLNSNEGKQYRDLAENIMGYYATLVEDGDHFYQMVIKKLDRDAVKYNNQAQIAESKRAERALKQSGMVNQDFFDKIKKDSVFAPFYNDQTVENAIHSFMPHLYDKSIAGWVDGIKGMIATITGEVYGSSEDKRRVENKIVSDLTEYIYKNFYVLNWNGKYNTLYEFFERDIIPEMKLSQIQSLLYKNGDVKADKSTLDHLKTKIGDEQLEYLSGYTQFANQIDLIRAKYPELMDLKIIQSLQSRRSSPQIEYEPPIKRSEDDDDGIDGVDPEDMIRKTKKRNITISEIFNMFSQMYLNMNLSTDPQTKFVDEQQVRDEWGKLLEFTPQTFSSVYDKIVANGREDFYKDEANASEIRNYFKLLSYYALVQNSHMDRSTGSFSYLAPASEITQVVENSLKNFQQALKGKDGKTITKLLSEFEKTFRQMNPDLGLKVDDEGGVAYRKEKVKSGKLYSKATMGNETLNNVKRNLFKKMAEQVSGEKDAKISPDYNNFLINNENAEKDAFTNCKG